MLIPNASPCHLGEGGLRERIVGVHARESELSYVYAGLVGEWDKLVFDGDSFALDAEGGIVLRMGQFVESVGYVQFDGEHALPGMIVPKSPLGARVYKALKLGVRDYLGKSDSLDAITGPPGGVDSALVLAIAIDALGADRARVVMMLLRYTVDISWMDARGIAARLGVQYDEIATSSMFDAFKDALAEELRGLSEDTTEESVRVCICGTLLMALSSKSD